VEEAQDQWEIDLVELLDAQLILQKEEEEDKMATKKDKPKLGDKTLKEVRSSVSKLERKFDKRFVKESTSSPCSKLKGTEKKKCLIKNKNKKALDDSRGKRKKKTKAGKILKNLSRWNAKWK